MRTGVFLYLLAVLEFNFLDSSNLIGESVNLPPIDCVQATICKTTKQHIYGTAKQLTDINY